MTANPSDPPIACSLTAAGQTTRTAMWKGLVGRALRERHMTARGVRLVFSPEPGVGEELRELARLEAECCAFADWRVEEDGDRFVLDVSADNAGIGAVQAMLEDVLSHSLGN